MSDAVMKCPECLGAGVVPIPIETARIYRVVCERGPVKTAKVYDRLLRQDKAFPLGLAAVRERLTGLYKIGLLCRTGEGQGPNEPFLWSVAETKAGE